MNHATVKVGLKRFHVVTWFGSMGYRKFKGGSFSNECLCPVCKGEMKGSVYIGDKTIVKDVGSPAYHKVVLREEFDEDGNSNFIDREGGKVE